MSCWISSQTNSTQQDLAAVALDTPGKGVSWLSGGGTVFTGWASVPWALPQHLPKVMQFPTYVSLPSGQMFSCVVCFLKNGKELTSNFFKIGPPISPVPFPVKSGGGKGTLKEDNRLNISCFTRELEWLNFKCIAKHQVWKAKMKWLFGAGNQAPTPEQSS